MEDFIGRLRRSLQIGRGISVPTDPAAAVNYAVTVIFANDFVALDEILASQAVDANASFHFTGRSLLLGAAYASAYECMNVLIKHGADVNKTDEHGYTPFLISCRNGNRKCIKKLVSHPAVDINQRDLTGLTGVHWLAANGRMECLLDCVPYIKDIDMSDDNGQTPLHVATKNGHLQVMEFLVDHGADINAASNCGTTPLHFACSSGLVPGLMLLLNKGAVHKPDNKGQYPIERAIDAEHLGVIIPMLEKYENLLSTLILLAVRDEVSQKKLLAVFRHVLQHMDCLNVILERLTETATNAGLKLLTSFSIIDVELFYLNRCIYFLSELSLKASRAQIKSIKQSLSDVWSSMEGWLNLLAQKIASHQEKLASGQESPDLQKDLGGSQEFQVLCPRISCILSAYYKISLIGLEPNTTPDNFLQFVSTHEKEIEFLIRRDPNVVTEHFSFLLSDNLLNQRLFKLVKIQPFTLRKEWFYKQLYETVSDMFNSGTIEEIIVSRDALFTSSCHQILRHDPGELKRMLNVQFKDEDGMGPGLLKEWFDTLSQEMLNPNYALFITSSDGCTFQPNPMSRVNPDHLNYFNFAGQLIGLALFHKQLISVYFTRSFYKHILGVPVSYQDVESIDPDYARNLQWILDNDLTDLGLGLTFTIENNMFGAYEVINLKSNGAKIPVTEENKEEYIQLVAEQKMTRSIQPQIHSFLQGFHKFIPNYLIKIFDEYELEILLSGVPEIDLADWKRNTEYIGFAESDDMIKWFWEVLEELGQEERVQLLQFSTGSSRVPFGGFSSLKGPNDRELKFTISQVTDHRLPSASTCVNMLKLPVYQSKAELKKNLLMASECSVGFGLA